MQVWNGLDLDSGNVPIPKARNQVIPDLAIIVTLQLGNQVDMRPLPLGNIQAPRHKTVIILQRHKVKWEDPYFSQANSGLPSLKNAPM
jgi:hypothetical protein